MTFPFRTILLCAALLGVACVPARADGLLVNGGFESSDFPPGWTITNNDGSTWVAGTSEASGLGFAPNSGSYVAMFGTQFVDDTISQTFSDIAGQHLTLTFFLAGGSLSAADFSAMIDSTVLLSISQTVDIGYVNSGVYTEYTYTFLGTGSDTVSFSGRNDNNYYALDDVSVTTDAPEPSSWMLLGTGLLGLMAVSLRRRGPTHSLR
jgi:hypothetical protein